MQRKTLIFSGVLFFLVLAGFVLWQSFNPKLKSSVSERPTSAGVQVNEVEPSLVPVSPEVATDQAKMENKLCDWIDKSQIIFELSFADGVEKDSSYEVGFFLAQNYFTARLAREGCNYRTGLDFSHTKGKSGGTVGVKGYTDSKVRHIESEPITVTFDADGKPSIGTKIQIKVIN